MHRHRLRAVFAQMHRAQLAIAAQRMVRIAMPPGTQADAGLIPLEHLVPQAHVALMRDQGFDTPGVDHHVDRTHAWCSASLPGTASTAGPGAASGSAARWRTINNASTKLSATPSATVLPIACSTGMLELASRLNTSRVARLQTLIACSARSWPSRSSPAWSKNRP